MKNEGGKRMVLLAAVCFILGSLFGAVLGLVLAALMKVSGDSDE